MLQYKLEMPLDLVINDSKIIRSYLYFIFLLSLISIFISAIALYMQIILCMVLIGIAYFYFIKPSTNQITSIKLVKDNKWKVEINNKNTFDVELCGECIVTYFIIWLNFTACNSFGKNKQFHVLLLPDSAEKDLLRKLRVRLRLLKNEKVVADGELLSD